MLSLLDVFNQRCRYADVHTLNRILKIRLYRYIVKIHFMKEVKIMHTAGCAGHKRDADGLLEQRITR